MPFCGNNLTFVLCVLQYDKYQKERKSYNNIKYYPKSGERVNKYPQSELSELTEVTELTELTELTGKRISVLLD